MNSVCARLPCCLLKCTVKHHLLDIYLTTFFGVRNFGNTLAMAVTFFCKCQKLNLGSKIEEKYWENFFVFIDNCIWIGYVKYSLLRTEY